MGVHGLTTFISHYRDKYKEKIYIRNTPILIDGCNLMYYLYFDGQNSVVTRGSTTTSPNKKRNNNTTTSNNTPKKKLPHAHLFGGDWVHYAQNIRVFFQQLKQCSIIPIVIMDGAYDSSKLEVAKQRFAKTVSDNVRKGDNNGSTSVYPGKTYTPVFLKTVFLEVLSEQKIIHYQTLGEADSTIAFIARLLRNCPILSCDSDFYIYINTKMIQLHSLKFAKAKKPKKETNAVADDDDDDEPNHHQQSKVWTLQGEFVPLTKLCKHEFKLHNHQLISLAAVILGNDILQHGAFKNFQSSQIGDNKNLKNRTASVMKWLAKQNSVEDGIKSLLQYFPDEHKRSKVESGIRRSLDIYDGQDGERIIWKRLMSDNSEELSEFIDKEFEQKTFNNTNDILPITIMSQLNLHEQTSSTTATTNNSNNLPDSFIQKQLSCQYQSYLLNILNNQVVFLSPQVEIYDAAAGSHEFSIPIIQVTAGILLGDPTAAVDLITHQKGKMFKKTISPVVELSDSYGKLPYLLLKQTDDDDDDESDSSSLLSKLPHEKLIDIIKSTLRLHESTTTNNPTITKFLKQWPSSYRIWIYTLVYYAKKRLQDSSSSLLLLQPHETLSILTSIYLCVIKNLIVNPGGGSTTSAANNRASSSSSGKDSSSSSASPIAALHSATATNPAQLHLIRKFYEKYEDYYNQVTCNRKFMRNYDIRLSNCLSEYLCILFHTEMLNNLLGNPMKSPKVRYNMNNFFVYNYAYHCINECKQVGGGGGGGGDWRDVVAVTGVENTILRNVLEEFVGIVCLL